MAIYETLDEDQQKNVKTISKNADKLGLKVSFADIRDAYDLVFVIANLSNGERVAHAKKNLLTNNDIANKINEKMHPNSLIAETDASSNEIIAQEDYGNNPRFSLNRTFPIYETIQ